MKAIVRRVIVFKMRFLISFMTLFVAVFLGGKSAIEFIGL